MTTIKEELEKSYRRSCLEGEIYLWQIQIVDHPEQKDVYKNAILENLDELEKLGFTFKFKGETMNELTFVCRIGNVNYLITGTENRIDAVEKLMKHLREKNNDIFIGDISLDMIDIIV